MPTSVEMLESKFLTLELSLLTGSIARRFLRVFARMSGRLGKLWPVSRFIDLYASTVLFTIGLICGLESCLTTKSGLSTVMIYVITRGRQSTVVEP
jgi:hypothetical protein